MDKSNQNHGTPDNAKDPSITKPNTYFVVGRYSMKEKIIQSFLKFKNAKLIFITGAARSGKSSLFESVTETTGHSGPGFNSVTRDYAVELKTIDDQHYLLVDTPGFRADDIPSETVLESIANLVRLVDGHVEYAGILQVYPTGTAWLKDHTNEVRALRQFCGDEFLPSVTFVSTKWDYYQGRQLQEQVAYVTELEQRWAVLMPGSRVYHHGMVNDGTLDLEGDRHERGRLARQMVSTHYGRAQDIVPQFVQELRRGIPVRDTSVARAFRGHGGQERGNPQQQQSLQQEERPNGGSNWTDMLWLLVVFVGSSASGVLRFIQSFAAILPNRTRFRPRFRDNGFEILITLPNGVQAVVGIINGKLVFCFSTGGSSGTRLFNEDELDPDSILAEEGESGSTFDNPENFSDSQQLRDAAENAWNETREQESSSLGCSVM